MNRRQFLIYSAAAGASVIVGGGLWHTRREDGVVHVQLDDAEAYAERVALLERHVADQDAARLLALLPSSESAAAVGEYVETASATERDETILLNRLKDKLLITSDSRGAFDYDALRDRLRRWITDDFAQERVGIVDGWLLSETGIELCLLSAASSASTAVRRGVA